MNKKQLIEKIEKADGSYIENKLKFTMEDGDSTIHAKSTENRMSRFIIKGREILKHTKKY